MLLNKEAITTPIANPAILLILLKIYSKFFATMVAGPNAFHAIYFGFCMKATTETINTPTISIGTAHPKRN